MIPIFTPGQNLNGHEPYFTGFVRMKKSSRKHDPSLGAEWDGKELGWPVCFTRNGFSVCGNIVRVEGDYIIIDATGYEGDVTVSGTTNLL